MEKKVKTMLKLELGIIFLVLIIFTIISQNLITFLPQCPINHFFNILCPSCGGTRCVINFVLGNFAKSFFYHPVFFITILYLLLVNILYIINTLAKTKVATFLYPKTKFWIVFLIILLIFTIIRNLL